MLKLMQDEENLSFSTFHCTNEVLRLKKNDFIIAEIKNDIKPLREIRTGNTFFHYTNARELPAILYSTEPNRKKAHEQTLQTGGYKSILNYSFKTNGDNVAGRGIYLSANPFSSSSYGKTQVKYVLPKDTKTLQMNHDKFNLIIEKFALAQFSSYCASNPQLLQVLKTLVLQASGVDLYLYDDPMMWFLLVNEDLIQETAIIRNQYLRDTIFEMINTGRASELDVTIFKISKPRGRHNVPPYNLSKQLSEHAVFQGDILKALAKNNELQILSLFISQRHPNDLSRNLNQNLEDQDQEEINAIVKGSCLIKMQDQQQLLADYLIENAPRKHRKKLGHLRSDLCH